SVSGDISAPVLVTANGNLNVTLTGKMTLKSRQVNTWNDNDADISVKVAAGNDVKIVAPGGLSVEGGTVLASTTDANSGAATAIADASLSAGGNVDITVANGSLLVQGGRAFASASADSDSYSARAEATANAEIRAGGSVTVNSVGGNFSIGGGSALAGAFDRDSSGCNACTANAVANATIAGDSVIINNVSGTFNVRAGNTRALGGVSNANVAATANAQLNAGTNLNIAMASNMRVEGGTAMAAFGSTYSGSGSTYSGRGSGWVSAVANAKVTSGGNATISIVDGGLSVLGGDAFALELSSGGNSGTISASAKAELIAGGQATVNVTGGSVMLEGGLSNPGNTTASPSFFERRASGSSGTMPLRKASGMSSVKAGLLQIMASEDVYANSASIDAGGIYIAAGNDLHLLNTTTTVGNGVAPGVSGDPLVLDILEKAGIPLPA
ncbi:MAG: hypothetical protein GY916_04895, partial [Gammaproteobacteria bacterium]|nr:hypothetical protein [Gammaproteobacteria bacterium]